GRRSLLRILEIRRGGRCSLLGGCSGGVQQGHRNGGTEPVAGHGESSILRFVLQSRPQSVVKLMRAKPSVSTTKPSILANRAVAAKGRVAPGAQTAASMPLVGAVFETGAAAAEQFPGSGEREIAFAGRSNAGKSSAINALARRRGLARAGRSPGRTREINFFRLRDGSRVADLPGYGYAAVPESVKRSWQDLLWSYVSARTQLVGLVLVVDVRRG